MFCTQVITEEMIEMLCKGDERLLNKMPTTVSGFGGCGGGAACAGTDSFCRKTAGSYIDI